MTQINLLSIFGFVKKYSGWIVAGIILLMMYTCQPEYSSAKLIKERDAQNKELEKKIDGLLIANKAKDRQIADSEKKVLEKEQIIKKLNGEIAKEKAKGEKQIAEQRKYNLKDWQKYYIEKTGYTAKEISIGNNTLNMTREPLVAIGNELVRLDVVKAELKITKSILAETQNIVVEKDKIIENQDKKIVTLLSINETNEQIKKNLVKNIDNLQSDLNKAKKPKLGTIAISALLGGIAGAVLAK